MAKACDREFDVLTAATSVAGEELRAHLASCSSCRELYDVARSIADDRANLMRNAPVPGAGLVWWRANMRGQREAARAAVRAGSLVQVALLLAAVIIALATLGISVDVHAVARSIAASTVAIPLMALAAWLILAPVAVYFAVTEE